MVNEENLIPITTKKQARELGSRGGKKRTPKKKFAARLRELKKKGLTNQTIKKLTNIIEDPECSILDIRMFLDSIKGDTDISTKERIRLANSYIKLHQALHGTIVKMDAKIDQRVIQYTITDSNDKYPRFEPKED